MGHPVGSGESGNCKGKAQQISTLRCGMTNKRQATTKATTKTTAGPPPAAKDDNQKN
jgi:hypothetical protein